MIQKSHIERWQVAFKKEAYDFLERPKQVVLFHALSIVTAIYIALTLTIPDAYWAGISALVIFNADYSGNLVKCFQRLVGTVVGAIIGLIFLFFFSDADFLFLGGLALVCLGGFLLMANSKSPYVFILGMATFFIVIINEWTNVNLAYITALYRTTEVIIGIIVACIFSSFYAAKNFKDWLHILFVWPTLKWFEWKHPFHKISAGEKMFAIKGTLAILGVPTLWIILNLPGLQQISISIIALIQLDPQKTSEKGFQRLMGCALGFCASCIVLYFSIDHIFPFLLVMYIVLAFLTQLHHGHADVSYSGTQAGVAFILGTINSLGPVHDFEPVFERFMGIFVAIFILSLLDYLWPWPKHTRSTPD